MQPEADVLDGPAAAQVLDLQHDGGVGRAGAMAFLFAVDDAAHHHAHDLVFGGLGGVDGADVLAVTHDGHPVGDAGDLVHAVGDIDHADALGAQVVHDGEQLLPLRLGEGGGRLVQYQQARVVGHGLGDLHHLLAAHRQAAQLDAGVDAHPDARQQGGGVPLHLAVVDKAAAHGLAPNKDVLRHRQVGHHVQFLVDDADAGPLGLADVLKVDRLPEQDDLAAVPWINACQHLHQRGFTGAVLAHQGVDLTGAQLKADALQRVDTGKPFINVLHLQDRLIHSHPAPFHWEKFALALGERLR